MICIFYLFLLFFFFISMPCFRLCHHPAPFLLCFDVLFTSLSKLHHSFLSNRIEKKYLYCTSWGNTGVTKAKTHRRKLIKAHKTKWYKTELFFFFPYYYFMYKNRNFTYQKLWNEKDKNIWNSPLVKDVTN